MTAEDLHAASDALLMGHVVVGDGDAVRLLIERHQNALLSLLRRATGSTSSADDLFQETWIRVVRSAHRYDPSQPFPPWLFAIAWNRIRDHWATRRPDEDCDFNFAALPSGEATAEEDLLRRAEAANMRRIIASLPERLAQALLLRYFEDLSERQISDRLGVPHGTVKSRLHNGLKKLALLWNGGSHE